MQYFQWRKDHKKYESELIITENNCFVAEAYKVAFNGPLPGYVQHGDTHTLAVNEIALDMQRNLLIELEQRMENLSSTSLVYFKTQKDALLLKYKNRIEEITSIRIPFIKQQIEGIQFKNSKNATVDIKKLRAQHNLQQQKIENKMRKNNQEHLNEINKKIEDYKKIEAELLDTKREFAHLSDQVQYMELSIKKQKEEIVTLTNESTYLKQNLESKTQALDQLTNAYADLKNIEQEKVILHEELQQVKEALNNAKNIARSHIRELNQKEADLKNEEETRNRQTAQLKQLESRRTADKQALNKRIKELEMVNVTVNAQLTVRKERIATMDRDLDLLKNLVGGLSNNKTDVISDIEKRLQNAMSDVGELVTQLKSTAEPLLRDNVELQKVLALDILNKKEVIVLETRKTHLDKLYTDMTQAIEIIERNKAVQEDDDHRVIFNDELLKYRATVETTNKEIFEISESLHTAFAKEQSLMNNAFDLQTRIVQEHTVLLKSWNSIDMRIDKINESINAFLALPKDDTGVADKLLGNMSPLSSPERTKRIKDNILSNSSEQLTSSPRLLDTPNKQIPLEGIKPSIIPKRVLQLPPSFINPNLTMWKASNVSTSTNKSTSSSLKSGMQDSPLE